ncbi:hypothetical protein R1sor_005747 [Riccia sorocarpa]|uniref:RCK C-terminal domain-containing protein n=1 Tax=Riccia sorocarpa TaxID=122646 RepID=A0ABD3HPN5_9MARC
MSALSGIPKPPFVIPEIQGWHAYTVLGLLGCMLISLVAELAPPYLVMMGTLVVLLALSILDVEAALHGFADEAMLSVAVLFVVAKGIEQSGGLEYVASVLFKTPDKTKEMLSSLRPSKTKGSIVWILLKFSVPVAIFSAFLANIPLVAMMIPPIVEFGKKVNMPPSKMLIPLSYAAQLGGTMTLIGASTNLMVLSMAAQKLPQMKMNLFEIGIIGVPVTIAGIWYIIVFSGKLLPDRLGQEPTTLNAREYNVVLVMKPTSTLARKSIEKSGINRQPGLTLLSVDREGTEITNPTLDFVLQPKDRLHFVGVIDSVLLLVQLKGLVLSEDEGLDQVDLNRLKTTQCLVEAVVASQSPMVQKRIADLQFRERYKAAVVAIHRYGARLNRAIGEIELEAGDCLLLVVDGPEFVNKHRNSSTFALVAQLPGFKPVNRRKAGIAAVLILALIVASGVGVKLITAALFCAAGLLITKCLSPRDAMESIELPVLIMIAAAFGIAEGMVDSGAAAMLAKALMSLAGKSLFGLVTCTYVATTIFSLAITNSAAVTIMFPVALAAANQQKLDFRPFAYILMMAASAGFMTPTGCPTNLMVYTPGGYRFSDYIYFGGLMQILLLLVTVGITMTAKYWFVWWIVIILITVISIPLAARLKSTHPHAPESTSSPVMKPSTSDTDAENPKALLIAGNADSSSFILKPAISITGENAGSCPSSSDPKPSSLPTSAPGASSSESVSKSAVDPPSPVSNGQMLQTSSTCHDSIVPQTAASSSGNLLLAIPSLGKSTLESAQHQLRTFSATDPSNRGLVSVSPSANLPNASVAPPPSVDAILTTVNIYTRPPALSSLSSKPAPELILPRSANVQTHGIPSSGPCSLHTAWKGTVLSDNTPPASNLPSMSAPPSVPTSTDSILEMEPNSSRNSSSTTSTSAPAEPSKLTLPSSQHPPIAVQDIEFPSQQGNDIVESGTLLTQSSTQSRGPSQPKTVAKTSASSSLGITAIPAAQTSQMGSIASKTQMSKTTSPNQDHGPVAAGRTNFFPQRIPPPTASTFPVETVSERTAAAKSSNLLSTEGNVKVTPATPTGPESGKSAATSTSMISSGTRLSNPVGLSIPVLLGPEAVAAKRQSLAPPQPLLPVPVKALIPPIPGPGTEEAKRASLTWQKQTKRPSLLGWSPPSRPISITIKDTSTAAVERSTNNSSTSSTTPISVISYKPKTPSSQPLPSPVYKNVTSANGQALENGRGNRKPFTTVPEPSESSTAEPLFFTKPDPSSKLSRRLTPPVWPAPTKPSAATVDSTKKRPSIEEDLTGGISTLLIPRRLSSIKDADSFADR